MANTPVLTNERIPELPAELRRAAKISTSGYWAGVLLAAADEIEAARRALEPTCDHPRVVAMAGTKCLKCDKVWVSTTREIPALNAQAD